MLAAGQADGLVCAKLDRLGRDVGDFADLLKRSTKERWALRLLDLDIDTSTSMGEAAAFVIAAFAQAERKRIGSAPARAWPSSERKASDSGGPSG